MARVIRGDRKRQIDVELGDVHEPLFVPQMKTRHWGNEVNLSARLVTAFDGVVEEVGERTTYRKADLEARWYPRGGFEDGGFEFEVVWLSPPASNVVDFTLRGKAIRAHRQPALTAQERAEGASRPPEIVGSYALFHATRAGNNQDRHYLTGKFAHVTRPFAVDAVGTRVWCGLRMNIPQQTMSITVPPAFVASATYPVTIDPTFGYTTIGGSTQSWLDDRLLGQLGNTGAAGTADSGSWYVTSMDANQLFGIYLESDLSLIATSAEGTSNITTPQWLTLNFSGESLSAVGYRLAAMCEQGTNFTHYYDAAASNFKQHRDDHTYDGTLPDPFAGPLIFNTRRASAYVTYTATGGSYVPYPHSHGIAAGMNPIHGGLAQ